jgi:hypothetical protein
MLKTGLAWFRLLIFCLVAMLAWQLSRGTEQSVAAAKAEWHPVTRMLNADTADQVMEQEYPGTNELFDRDDGTDDCVHDAILTLPPPRLDHIKLMVSCLSDAASGKLKVLPPLRRST